MKRPNLSALLFLLVLLVAGCSAGQTPSPTTLTPLPVIVKEAIPKPTVPSADPESIQSGETNAPMPEETAAMKFQPAEEVVVEKLEIRSLNRFPVKILVSVGGIIRNGCLEIDGWEKTVGENTIFLVPQLTRLEDGQCLDRYSPIADTLDLELQDRSVTELISEDYTLDVNGFTMNLGFAASSSLLQEEVSGCPERRAGEILYFNEEAGFCLLFPNTFTIRDDEAPDVVSFYGPPLDEHDLEPLRAMLFVNYQELAGGRTLEQIAADRQVKYEGTDQELIITPDSLDDHQALLIEGAGEMANSLQIVTIYEDAVFVISVLPYHEFPAAAEDVELVWDLFVDSFTFLRPQVNREDDQLTDIAEFEGSLMEAISTHNFEELQSLMDDTFGFAFWLSEGFESSPEEAAEQLRLSYLLADSNIIFVDPVPPLDYGSGGKRDVLSIWNPVANPIGALFSTGWGSDGGDEAILIVTQSPEGILSWGGIIFARGEMGGFAGPETDGG